MNSNIALNQQKDIVIPREWNGGVGNAIGVEGGAFGFQRQMAKLLYRFHPDQHGTINPDHHPDLKNTEPVFDFPENQRWENISTFHPFGHRAAADHATLLEEGVRFLPTISVTRSRFKQFGILAQILAGQLKPDGKVLLDDGSYEVTDVNIDPVWDIDGVAERLDMPVKSIRDFARAQAGKYMTGKVPYFLPPMDGPNVHIFGDPALLQDPETVIAARSHDYCRDGDNGAMRCVCAAQKQYATEEMIRVAQNGGVGLLVLNPEEGRNFGSVPKHLVYGKRSRMEGGDREETYFRATQEIFGGDDARMHWTKADVFKWLLPYGRIDHWFSESPHKRDSLEAGGIQIVRQYELPKDRIHPLAFVEINAKRGNGYHGESKPQS